MLTMRIVNYECKVFSLSGEMKARTSVAVAARVDCNYVGGVAEGSL